MMFGAFLMLLIFVIFLDHTPPPYNKTQKPQKKTFAYMSDTQDAPSPSTEPTGSSSEPVVNDSAPPPTPASKPAKEKKARAENDWIESNRERCKAKGIPYNIARKETEDHKETMKILARKKAAKAAAKAKAEAAKAAAENQ